jgi:hypothetical protein
MKIQVPLEFDEKFAETVAQYILDSLQVQQNQFQSVIDLPPYPNRKQVKKILKIGDERLNQWIENGLKVIPFGKEARFDRNDIRNFLNQLKT